MSPAAPSRWRELALTLLVTSLMGYSWMFGEITVPNERSRVYLAVALVDHGTLSIDAPVARFGRVADAAAREGRLYTDKAPGSSVLGAAVYAGSELFVDRRSLSVAELIRMQRRWLMLPLAALGFWVTRRVLRRLGTREAAVDIASLSLFLGTAMFHYGAAFFGHALVAFFLLASLALTWSDAHNGPRLKLARRVGAGMAAGMAGFLEYQAIPVAALLFAYVAYEDRRNLSGLACFSLGAAPFAAALLAYNAVAFGGPLELPYEHLLNQQVQARHTRGIGGVGLPTAAATWGSLFSLHRGLLATSPVSLLFPLGLVYLVRDQRRALAALLGTTVAFYLAFIFGADMWYAGWGFGPRLLVPCLVPLFLGVGVALDRLATRPVWDGVARGLAVYGVVYAALVAQTFAELPEAFTRPLADLALPALTAGQHAPNLITAAGAAFGLPSLIPAWLLTGVAVACIAARGLGSVSPGARLRTLSVALALPALALGVLANMPASIDVAEQQRFLAWMQRLSRSE